MKAKPCNSRLLQHKYRNLILWFITDKSVTEKLLRTAKNQLPPKTPFEA